MGLFAIKNLLITLKAMVVGLIVGLVLFVAQLFMAYFAVLGTVIAMLLIIFSLFLWGYLASEFWRWK